MIRGARGCPRVPAAGWARDAGQGWHFGAAGGNGGLSSTAEGLSPGMKLKEGTELRKPCCVSGKKKSSNLILHSRAGQNHSPSSMAYADTRAGGLPAALSAPKKLWAFTPSSPNAAEHPSPLSQMPAHGDRGPEQVRNHCIGVGWTS